ncbi:Very-short-patch-repair endonuclease [Micromonospora pallida]|uniref:Very-short-patch-repair endonuclease n=2 Tax=Micromonospora pallida TaxID=145854 RepID=A0A1C6TEL6_9ACTN|nr:Very-short-patch-repair endonuclease [Micromonospora pallida]
MRLGHDVYADARLPRDHGLTCRAAALFLPAGAMIAGPSAAYLHGVEHAATFESDVHVLTLHPTRMESRKGIQVHTTGLATELTGTGSTDGRGAKAAAGTGSADERFRAPVAAGIGVVPRSRPEWAAWETAAWLDLVRAVGIVDTMLALGLITRAALVDLAGRLRCRPGGRRATHVFDLVDPGAQSPPESHLRVRLVLAGLPRPVTQHPVRVSSGLVLHPDLAWPEFRVAVEYDGQWHADPEQLHRDRRRLNQLVNAGWLVLHVTGRRLRHDFPAVLREIRTALAARGWRG